MLTNFYIGETKANVCKCKAHPRRGSSSGQDPTFRLHLKEKGHSFENENKNVYVLDREERWFEKGVKETIYVNLEQP